jgi:hypothetical protein
MKRHSQQDCKITSWRYLVDESHWKDYRFDERFVLLPCPKNFR